MMGYAISALFFLRFWTRTRDPLFAIFSLSFAILSLERWILFLTYHGEDESQAVVYLMRAFAFGLIIYGVVQKNRSTEP